MNDGQLDATIAACRQLITSRFPADEDAGAAARQASGRTVVLSPCGICRERLAIHGPDVLVAVADPKDPIHVQWKKLSAVLPDYWLVAFPEDIDPRWLPTS